MKSWHAQLGKVFEKIDEVEDKLEELRLGLRVNCADIDVFCNNFITAADIVSFLQTKSVALDQAQANLFIANWDWDQDGKLTYAEFLNWADCYKPHEISSTELTQMLCSEIKALHEIEAEKFRLNQLEGFNPLDLFISIEPKQAFISIEKFKIFIEEISNSQLKFLSKALRRMCKSHSTQINYFEFTDFLLYNKAYFCLCGYFPDQTISPLSLNYSVCKSIIENSPERSEIFSVSQQSPYKTFVSAKEDPTDKLNELKVSLALKKDFTAKSLFKFFAGKKKTVNRTRLQKGLQKLGIRENDLFDQFSPKADNELNEEHFFDFFAPKSEGYKLLLRNRAKQSVEIGNETMSLISEIFKLSIKLA